MDPITIEMRPLYEKARWEGKWLYCRYQNLWFRPEQLEADQRAGRFRWGPDNWEVRDPMERITAAKRRLDDAQTEYDRVVADIGKLLQPS